LKPYLNNRKTNSEIRYIFGPNSFSQIPYELLESTKFKTPDDSKNGKWIKLDLTCSPLEASFVKRLDAAVFAQKITLPRYSTNNDAELAQPSQSLSFSRPNNIL
jgi:hypothetical protein